MAFWPFNKKKEEDEEEFPFQENIYFTSESLSKVDAIIASILSGLVARACLRCGMESVLESTFHFTWYKYGPLGYHKLSVLCKDCWNCVSIDERLNYYRIHYDALLEYSKKYGENTAMAKHWQYLWAELEKTVMEGK
uniref:Uncharacterized protein n=1 Tax=viral metagenome TaxID=1070528 RepID=A0A6M3JMC8_9ZZZZ